jgi:D-threo-aldose 1-dehydrogenase
VTVLSRRPVGATGVELTVLGFGAATLGGLYASLPDEVAQATVEAARDAGIAYFDTAPFYGHGMSEHRLGRGLRKVPRDEIVLSTKVGRMLRPVPADQVGQTMYSDVLPFRIAFDYSYDGVMRSIEDSWQRLGMSRIDIAYLHDVNRRWHGDAVEQRFAETMQGGYRALDELRRAGVIKAIGVGVNDPGILCRFADAGRFDLFMLAGRYTLLEQTPLDDLLPLCEARGIAITIAAPFNSGILVTGARAGAKYFYIDAPPEILDKTRRIEEVCDAHAVPLPAAALQFPLGHPAVASVVAGLSSPAEVDAAVRNILHPIPAAFWSELQTQGLLRADAPVPTENVHA